MSKRTLVSAGQIEYRNKTGVLHRHWKKGPALINSRLGQVEYWYAGWLHRPVEEGPAIRHGNGAVEFYVNGWKTDHLGNRLRVGADLTLSYYYDEESNTIISSKGEKLPATGINNNKEDK